MIDILFDFCHLVIDIVTLILKILRFKSEKNYRHPKADN